MAPEPRVLDARRPTPTASLRPLWTILGAALALRAALLAAGWTDPLRFMTRDSYEYDALARGLLERGEFAPKGGRVRVEIFRTPGYPVFLAGVYAVTAGSVRAAVLTQMLLDVGLCGLVYVLGLRLCSRRAGLIAAAVQAASPAVIVSAVRLLSESLFALLLTAALLLVLAALRDLRRLWLALPAGLLLGLACLVRPIGQFYPILPALAMLPRLGVRRCHWAVLFLSAALVPISGWTARNYLVTGRTYAQLSSVGDWNVFYCNALPLAESDPAVRLNPTQEWFKRRVRMIGGSATAAASKNDLCELPYIRREGMAIIAEHPGRYALFHLRTTLNVFLPASTDVLEVAGVTRGDRGTLAVLQRHGLAAAARHYFAGRLGPLFLAGAIALITLAKYAAALVGVFRHARLRMGAEGWLVTATILYFVLVPGPVAHARFRVPVAPLLSVLAAAGVVFLWARWHGQTPHPRGAGGPAMPDRSASCAPGTGLAMYRPGATFQTRRN